MDERFDVVVIGGGAAGLSGAVALARARRSVLVVDAGDPRNTPAGHIHNYLGREGAPPGELLAAGRADLVGYGGRVVMGTVTAAERTGDGFRVHLADDSTVRARRLLVTTGLVDELPDVEGLAARWGRDVLHCPYCHGWEVREQAIGVLSTGPMAIHQVQLFRQLSADVTLFLHTGPEPTEQEWEQLAACGIAVVDGEVAAVEVTDDRLTGVRLRSGEVVARQAVVVGPRFTARVPALLGLEATDVRVGEQVIGSQVGADATGATAVPGVWVAGNVADVMAQVVSSAAAGLGAGAAINADLVAEDVREAVAARAAGPFSVRAGRELCEQVSGERHHGLAAEVDFDEDFWEGFYGARTAVWSGNPNPQLVVETSRLTAGSALDVGCGEGADAVWLASRGWTVTGVDLSATALQRAAVHAEAAGVNVRWSHADLAVSIPDGMFDLVSAQFMQLPPEPRRALFARLAAAVAPAGTLLIVGHHPSAHRPPLPGMFYTAQEVAESLDADQWSVLVADTRPRTTADPDGQAVMVHDSVLRARRRL